MFGNTGHIHRKKLTRAEQKAALEVEAQEAALECERQAAALGVIGTAPHTIGALKVAARLLRRFGFGPEAGL